MIFNREHFTRMTPPDNAVILCPECGATVEALILRSIGASVEGFATEPCAHIHDPELLHEVTGRSKGTT